MVAAVTALGGVTERQEETLVAAGERLQAQVPAHRKFHRLTGEVAGLVILGKLAIALNQAFMGENIGDAHDVLLRHITAFRLIDRFVGEQRRIEQAVGIVEGRPEKLAARQVLVGRRNAPLDLHRRGIDRNGGAEARQRGAIGAQQEDRFDHVAARLADGQRSKRPVIE